MRVDNSQPLCGVFVGVVAVCPLAAGEGLSVSSASTGASSPGERVEGLWLQVFSLENLDLALKRVVGNKGAAGIDGVTVDELEDWLAVHWSATLSLLVEGTYRPSPVRRVEIPKPDGGVRLLGVPTVVDRFIQQAITQVLGPLLDPGFSESSYGYRPGRSAHHAVDAARGMAVAGYAWVVELDLDRFFDRVNHDMVMARLARRVADKALLRLVRRYLEAGVMVDGVKLATREGTPQGSPLSPLLSNVLLDDLDRELESRGHLFVRYADDVRIYVKTRRAAERVLSSIGSWIESRLKLRVNWDKSRVGRFTQVTLLGFALFVATGTREVRIRIAPKARRRVKAQVRWITSRSRGISMAKRMTELNRFTAGWVGYFALAETPSVFRDLDQWTRRRLRQVQWVMWKNNRTRVRELKRLGVDEQAIYIAVARQSGSWRASNSYALNSGLDNDWWTRQGFTGFTATYQRHQRT